MATLVASDRNDSSRLDNDRAVEQDRTFDAKAMDKAVFSGPSN